MLHAKPNNRFYENKLYKNIKVFVFVFEILLKVFVSVFKYICIWKYLYLYLNTFQCISPHVWLSIETIGPDSLVRSTNVTS